MLVYALSLTHTHTHTLSHSTDWTHTCMHTIKWEAKSPLSLFHPPHFDGSVHIIAVWKKGKSKIKKRKLRNLLYARNNSMCLPFNISSNILRPNKECNKVLDWRLFRNIWIFSRCCYLYNNENCKSNILLTFMLYLCNLFWRFFNATMLLL